VCHTEAVRWGIQGLVRPGSGELGTIDGRPVVNGTQTLHDRPRPRCPSISLSATAECLGLCDKGAIVALPRRRFLQRGNLQELEAEGLQGFWFWVPPYPYQTAVSYLADTPKYRAREARGLPWPQIQKRAAAFAPHLPHVSKPFLSGSGSCSSKRHCFSPQEQSTNRRLTSKWPIPCFLSDAGCRLFSKPPDLGVRGSARGSDINHQLLSFQGPNSCFSNRPAPCSDRPSARAHPICKHRTSLDLTLTCALGLRTTDLTCSAHT
jgi:hypothetical protein